jgi:hypothetical protein
MLLAATLLANMVHPGAILCITGDRIQIETTQHDCCEGREYSFHDTAVTDCHADNGCTRCLDIVGHHAYPQRMKGLPISHASPCAFSDGAGNLVALAAPAAPGSASSLQLQSLRSTILLI